MSSLLEVNNLSVEFSTSDRLVRAVEDISFSIEAGETVGLVGESGSGKSVSALSIMRLLAKSASVVSGNIRFHGKKGDLELLELPERQMRDVRGNAISMIFQEPMTSLNPVFSCGDQVAECLLLHRSKEFANKKAARDEVVRWFKEVKLQTPEQLYDRYPHQLSGGQKQRVMIAMAMCCNPQLLIADEPTTALDVIVQEGILDLMMELQARHKMSILFISHDLSVIARIAHKVIVMFKGKIVEMGRRNEVFLSPHHSYTKALLACRPSLDKRLRRLPIVADFIGKAGLEATDTVFSSHPLLSDVVSLSEREAQHRKLYQAKPLLEVKDVNVYYTRSKGFWGIKKEEVYAVNNISFEVFPGETLGLVGESGCGKTTLGKTIVRLLEPSDGAIRFKGKDITHLNQKDLRAVRKEIQIIFQDPFSSLNPRMSVGEAIVEPMKYYGLYADSKVMRKQAINLLERVELDEKYFDHYPHEFSGGQRQRIVIARSLALQPRFIICDEPVSALDVSVQAQVLNLLNNLKKEFGMTYIFISHDLSVVKHMSDRMVVMKNGRMEEIGEADDVYANSSSPYTRSLIRAIPKPDLR